MIYQFNKETGRTKTIRQNWKEWFVVTIGEGYSAPLFYLPVVREVNRCAYQFWIFPVAPFILAYSIIKNAFFSIWRDLLELQRALQKSANRNEHE
jgi:hypothetical protein